MAWVAPMTATTGNVHTAAEFNVYWRDNLLASEASAATAPGRLLVSSAAHTLVERIPSVAYTGGFDSTTSTSYVGLTDPTEVNADTGQWAMLMIGGQLSSDGPATGSRMSVAISGATTLAAADGQSFYAESANLNDSFQGTYSTVYSPLTAGFQQFGLRYKCQLGGTTSTFGHRLLAVLPF